MFCFILLSIFFICEIEKLENFENFNIKLEKLEIELRAECLLTSAMLAGENIIKPRLIRINSLLLRSSKSNYETTNKSTEITRFHYKLINFAFF